MKTQKIVLAFALASSVTTFASAANNVIINTGIANTLQLLAQKSDGVALNLAANTGNVDASVNTVAGLNWVQGAVETSAIGAVNTGDIALEQATTSSVLETGVDSSVLAAAGVIVPFAAAGGIFAADYSAGLNSYIDGAASNYAAANVAYNSGNIDATVNTIALGNRVDSVKTSAIGAAQTGAITVTVK
ncbi:hypothetical protein [Acinetobacter ursingii]|uniref:hypothetical protein n=1 Tax=Acinetobacter ursingii TaxID=108980 RepID=UPI00125014AF|nr:hypothetical protein [Acinetobacter ursingii]NOZ96749.1 hypothetical protein [Gammaproteobacteria bacterium]